MPETDKPSDVKIIREFFGQKPGQSMQEFFAEYKQLMPDDRKELVALINAERVSA